MRAPTMSSLRLRVLACSLPLALASCAPDSFVEPDPSERGGGSIVNGTETADYPAAVALIHKGRIGCSGTLIAPRKVLTAAHCLDLTTPSDFSATVTDLKVGFGPRLGKLEAEIPVVGGTIHPKYLDEAYDVAVLTLIEDAPATPVGLLRTMDDSWVGEEVRVVGYGASNGKDHSGVGVKRMADLTIDSLTKQELLYKVASGKAACVSDSGGPAFVERDGKLLVAGIASRGDAACAERGIYGRVDAYLDFIEEELSSWGCDDAYPLCCDPNDPSCRPSDGACGDVTYEGYCDGNTLVFCGNILERIDCNKSKCMVAANGKADCY